MAAKMNRFTGTVIDEGNVIVVLGMTAYITGVILEAFPVCIAFKLFEMLLESTLQLTCHDCKAGFMRRVLLQREELLG